MLSCHCNCCHLSHRLYQRDSNDVILLPPVTTASSRPTISTTSKEVVERAGFNLASSVGSKQQVRRRALRRYLSTTPSSTLKEAQIPLGPQSGAPPTLNPTKFAVYVVGEDGELVDNSRYYLRNG